MVYLSMLLGTVNLRIPQKKDFIHVDGAGVRNVSFSKMISKMNNEKEF